MTDWSLSVLMSQLHRDVENRLRTARETFGHPGVKGDASEKIWISMLEAYLPKRYQVDTAHIVDVNGKFSQQIDVVVFDRQYTPFIFTFEDQKIIPAEAVYAIFEAKQTANASLVAYAQEKVASVRALHRTSLPIPHAGGKFSAKEPHPILGGLLTFESDWNPPLGRSLDHALGQDTGDGLLDLGCIAAHGHFYRDRKASAYVLEAENKPATAFLLKLISELQRAGTVPMIDIEAYSAWLTA